MFFFVLRFWQLFEAIAKEELGNVFSNGTIEPPKTAEQAASWYLAGQLITASRNEQVLSPEMASHVATRACAALDAVLLPLLHEDRSVELSAPELPIADVVNAISCLAARAATRSDKDGLTAADTTDCLLRCAEQCTALGLELGADNPVGSYAIQLSLASATNIKLLLEYFAASKHVMVLDIAARMQVILVSLLFAQDALENI